NSWIMQIAKNHAIDVYRSDIKQVKMDDEVLENIISDQTEKPDKKTLALMMLDILDQDERTIVVLKILDDLTHKEISKIVNKPLGTVLWIYQKAMVKLKGYYGEKNA
ncbi:MAG: RNA polymerase sigma factor, partial [Acholeplasma sp.]